MTVSGNDEVAALGKAFNEMAARLQAADQKQRELEQARKDLIAWASHDLQTPLASVRAILEALADGVVEEPDIVKRYLNTAQRDVRSLSSLIDDLFQMAQLDAGGLQLNRNRPRSLTSSRTPLKVFPNSPRGKMCHSADGLTRMSIRSTWTHNASDAC